MLMIRKVLLLLFPCSVLLLISVMKAPPAYAQWTGYVVAPADDRRGYFLPEEIAKINQELLAKGSKKAAWELGLAYMQAYGVPQDFDKAEQMYEIGATDAEQKGMVGMFYAQGMYFPKNIEMAKRWYTAAGRPGDLFALAEAYKAAAKADKADAPIYYPKATALYLSLLKDAGYPEVRRAEMELGNFVIDGIYSAGKDADAHAQNLEWARIIAQELLGQEEYKIAVDYAIGREDLPKDEKMWLLYCKRAAAYNIDLAQHYYVDALTDGRAPDLSGYDYIVWTRLAAQKQYGESVRMKAYTDGMSAAQLTAADKSFAALERTRKFFGAYYPADDPLKNITPAALAAMPQDDPDVQLRRAFSLEKAAANNPKIYEQVLDAYRTVRNRRKMDIRFVLGRNSLEGRYGVPKNKEISLYWLHEAANEGSKPSQNLLKSLAASGMK